MPNEPTKRELALRTAIIDALIAWEHEESVLAPLRAGLRKARGDAHPEDRCEECWEPFEPWATTPEAWESVTGRAWGGPILCRTCFDRRKERDDAK